MNRQQLNPVKPRVLEYQARTLKPLTATPVHGDGKARVIPGAAKVTIHENTGREIYTATAYLDGAPYWTEITPAQFTPITSP